MTRRLIDARISSQIRVVAAGRCKPCDLGL